MHAARDRPDVVLALNVANGPSLALLEARNVPVALNVDGVEWERAKWGTLAKRAFRIGASTSARYATELIADSREIARIWQRDFARTPAFIPYGADVITSSGVDRVRALGLEQGDYAIAVARLAPENNVELFVEALERLNFSVPAVVVGSANYSNPLEQRLRDLHSKRRLVWLGHVSDQALLSELWSNAGVYFHGHSVGGTNPALLQALGHGAPTLALDTPFNREVVIDDRHLIRPDVEHIASRMARVLADSGLRTALTLSGQETIRDRYSWDHVLESYEAVLHATATRGRAARRA